MRNRDFAKTYIIGVLLTVTFVAYLGNKHHNERNSYTQEGYSEGYQEGYVDALDTAQSILGKQVGNDSLVTKLCIKGRDTVTYILETPCK